MTDREQTADILRRLGHRDLTLDDTDREQTADILRRLGHRDLTLDDIVGETLEVIRQMEECICALEIRADDAVHLPNENDE